MPRKRSAWNHNIHYHRLVLRAIPDNCPRALDVGCGQGLLARKLAKRCKNVVGIDIDHGALASARNEGGANIAYIEGDALTYPFADNHFDMITGIAVLHHMQLGPALDRFRTLLTAGGTLCMIGLYRHQTAMDYLFAAAAVPLSLAVRGFRGQAEVGAPTTDARETLAQIRATASTHLPGARIRRHLFFRYSLVWKKPVDARRP
jgi:ubiquinone/menaquinone biosynthesis C-methylase UbiE